MPDLQDFLQVRNELQPGADFEDRVFLKINKKEKTAQNRRRPDCGSRHPAIGFTVAGISSGHPAHAANPDPGTGQRKEEIPLHEDLFFSSSDQSTRYTIEPVSMQKTATGSQAVINEI